MTSTQQDHVVLLLPTPSFTNLPDFLTSNFTITPGGTHVAQPSRNHLIIFADGTYLELFNWHAPPPSLDDVNLPMRVWGPKAPGLIDFAITDTSRSAEDSVAAVNDRLSSNSPGSEEDFGLGIKYGTPVPGGRKKATGEEIKWKVTRPEFSRGANTPSEELFPTGRIDVPFFCHDVTARRERVPSDDVEKTTHACGAVGIKSCEVLVPGDLLAEYAGVYAKILGSKPKAVDGQGSAYAFDVGVPGGFGRSSVVVRAAETEKDIERMHERGIGFSGLVLAVKSDAPGSETRRSLGDSGIAATIWLEKVKES
ncbi:glyoxalase-like protein [Nemania sp. FL0916]|nr:glyoxalase-like protein [Nemania sp. FL0916]